MNIDTTRIGDIFRVLGAGQDKMVLQSPETPFMYRSRWQCGCAVDYIDANVGPFDWARCTAHRDPSETAACLRTLNRSDTIASSGR